MKIKRALISVYDKTDIVPFAKKLRAQGVEIISTGGTLATLQKNKIKATSISKVTCFPEILEGRVKTLHPVIHGGLLYLRGNKKQRKEAAAHGINPIDLVVVNLYPFTKVIQKKNISLATALENIDIGGPTMLRAAAKNFSSVAVVCDINDYDLILSLMKRHNGGIPQTILKKLAEKVFSLTASYDAAIQIYLASDNKEMPTCLSSVYKKALPLRYGENPHQKGAFYKKRGDALPFKQLHGKEISYNNIMDFYAAREIINEFVNPAAAVIKHTNPCGIAESCTLEEAINKAIYSDPLSAFGGIVIVNCPVGRAGAARVLEKLAFFEMLIAPSFTPEALGLLKTRKNLRIIETGDSAQRMAREQFMLRYVGNGMLMQEHDIAINEYLPQLKKQMKVVSKRKPSSKDMTELIFAWKCAKVVKSNAVVLTKDAGTIGIGAGQMSRIDAMEIACRKAGTRSSDAYVASDGFFPKADNITVAAKAGVKAIIQPGGSIRDGEVIDAVNKHNLMMVLTGKRHFRH
ncbi:MAG: bifunctional phosphoribosylaminoimidazolecarboxamide formyltransferase/IMP cyclohydrolase [Candidatus Omnitrophica bacterium]|nr:bifunctional phosphoribosylaminoimidazolecarboxamide formyltransferase/IMP cyclohydrolase [Candidatus Omnitrophota bacterium]